MNSYRTWLQTLELILHVKNYKIMIFASTPPQTNAKPRSTTKPPTNFPGLVQCCQYLIPAATVIRKRHLHQADLCPILLFTWAVAVQQKGLIQSVHLLLTDKFIRCMNPSKEVNLSRNLCLASVMSCKARSIKDVPIFSSLRMYK
jgi:hypothetical protein